MIDREQEYLKMEATEKELWWYRILHRIVHKQLLKNKTPENASILDAGCGTGGLMTYLSEAGYSQLKGIDLSEKAVEICRQKGLNVSKGNVGEIDKVFASEKFDVIISNDVLCYFESDEQLRVITKLASLLRPGGVILMNLPSFQAFKGMHDLGVGIKHRFNRSDFRRFKQLAGLRLSKYFYWPFLLSPLIFTVRSVQRVKLKINPKREIKSDVNLPPRILNKMFYWITKFELSFSNWSVFGSSTFLVFKKQ